MTRKDYRNSITAQANAGKLLQMLQSLPIGQEVTSLLVPVLQTGPDDRAWIDVTARHCTQGTGTHRYRSGGAAVTIRLPVTTLQQPEVLRFKPFFSGTTFIARVADALVRADERFHLHRRQQAVLRRFWARGTMYCWDASDWLYEQGIVDDPDSWDMATIGKLYEYLATYPAPNLANPYTVKSPVVTG